MCFQLQAKGEVAKEAASSAKAGADVAPGAAAVAASPADPSAPADAAKKVWTPLSLRMLASGLCKARMCLCLHE